MDRRRSRLGATIAMAFGLAVFTGTAVAGNGHGPPAGAGNSANAPGQQRKADAQPAAAQPAPAQPAAATPATKAVSPNGRGIPAPPGGRPKPGTK
jgi:hypothetical protein